MTSKLLNKLSSSKWCVLIQEVSYNLLLFRAKKHTVNNLENSFNFSEYHPNLVTKPEKFNGTNSWSIMKRLYSDFKYRYAPDVEKAINKQIQVEQQAAQDYLAIAVVFLHPYQSRPGTGGFFMTMFEEEMKHMQDLVQYQLQRGAMPFISGLSPPKINPNLTMLESFKTGLAMEKSVTEHLEAVLEVAKKSNDEQCAEFIVSKFLNEQMESINEMSHHVSKLSRLCDEHSLYHYDLWLSKNYPWACKLKSSS